MQNAIFSKNSQRSDGKTEKPNSRQQKILPEKQQQRQLTTFVQSKCVNYHHVKKRKVPIKEKESKK